MLTKANVVESAAYLKEKLPFVPEIALVLGSGIGPLADEVENPTYVPYGEIPHFKVSTAPDHACEGFARIDFFVRKSDGEIILNEINTIPGFTSISMYPKLWAHCGMSYSELLDRLIQLGLERR